jgi:hypothetical protein
VVDSTLAAAAPHPDSDLAAEAAERRGGEAAEAAVHALYIASNIACGTDVHKVRVCGGLCVCAGKARGGVRAGSGAEGVVQRRARGICEVSFAPHSHIQQQASERIRVSRGCLARTFPEGMR